MTGTITLLGTGTSFGVPVIGCTCEVCTSDDPRDKRTRVSAVLQFDGGPSLLIDTPPEIRLQLIRAGVHSVDAVLYTHDHADHVHGIDDLRAISVQRGLLPLYGMEKTLTAVAGRFDYIFNPAVKPAPGSSKPELKPVAIPVGEPTEVAGAPMSARVFNHGPTEVLGFRFEKVAYLTDVKLVSDEAIEWLKGVDVLVINALFEKPHASHLSIPEAVSVAERVGAGRTLLTHLTHRYSHAEVAGRLPDGIEPGYDGVTIPF